jgi:hypothetical protein
MREEKRHSLLSITNERLKAFYGTHSVKGTLSLVL